MLNTHLRLRITYNYTHNADSEGAVYDLIESNKLFSILLFLMCTFS